MDIESVWGKLAMEDRRYFPGLRDIRGRFETANDEFAEMLNAVEDAPEMRDDRKLRGLMKTTEQSFINLLRHLHQTYLWDVGRLGTR